MAHNSLIRNPVTKWVPYSTASWIKLTGYTTPQLVFPTVSNGFVYECTTTGTSGSTEPAWPLIIGNTVTDGSVVWTCYSTIAILVAELQALDASLQAGINVVDGSTHAPTSPIVIGGSGLAVTGLLTIARFGYLNGTVIGDIALNDNDFPVYVPPHVGQTRTFMQPAALGRGVDNFTWRCRFSDCGMQSVSAQYDLSDGLGMRGSCFMIPIRAHDQSMLSQVTVNFRVGFAHATLPGTMPSCRVIRVGLNGVPVPLTSLAAGGDANGNVYVPKPASVAFWSPAQGGQQLVITCDQNNVVDLTQYAYYVEIVEEQWPSGTGYPWQLVYLQQPAKLMGFAAFGAGPPVYTTTPLVDGTTLGHTPVNGERILLVGLTRADNNGIWDVVASGYWQRAPDWIAAAGAQGLVVPIDQGANGGGYVQVASTLASWSTGTAPLGTFTWQASSSYASGTVVPLTNPTGYWYTLTTPGTTGSADPSWPSTIGATVTDGTAVWTCGGLAATSLSLVGPPPTDDETPATAGTGFFSHGNIWQSVEPLFTEITDAHWQ